MAALRKTLIRGYEHSLLNECQCPQIHIVEPLLIGTANVLDVVTEFP